jgi:hypothetical protein
LARIISIFTPPTRKPTGLVIVMNRELQRRVLLNLTVAFMAAMFLSSLLCATRAFAQGDQPRVLSVMGKAEIRSAGRVREAQTGDLIRPGESVSLSQDANMRLSASNGKAEIALNGGTEISYDGEVDINSRPWKDDAGVAEAALPQVPPGERGPQFSLRQGRADVNVEEGEPLRVVTPLLMAAVRGTHFVVTVLLDGTSSVMTIEGQVFVVTRIGLMQIASAGGTVEISSSDYAAFLEQNGVSVPNGDWSQVAPSSLEKIDVQTFGETVRPTGAEGTVGGTGGAGGVGGAGSGATGAAQAVEGAVGVTGTGTSSVLGAVAQVAPVALPTLSIGAAGIATGTLTQDHSDATPVPSVPSLPGHIIIKDPSTGEPATHFVTGKGGEFEMEIEASEGQTQVAMTVGGVTYLVDLAEEIDPGPTPPTPGEVVFDYVDFINPSTGFQSTATLTPNFDGHTPTGSVMWSIVSVSNPTAPWWQRGPSDMNGLTWGPSADGMSYWTNSSAPEGTVPYTAVAQLTDVVGNRTIIVRAETYIDGELKRRDLTVAFGKGPLSVFSSAPNLSGRAWAEADDILPFLALDPDNPSNFPSAALCSGRVPVDAIAISGVPPDAIITPNPSVWTLVDYDATTRFYTASSINLPTRNQLTYVSRSLYTSRDSTKGAALAAGWDYSRYYWTNTIAFYQAEDHSSQMVFIASTNVETGQSLGYYPIIDTVFTICANSAN